MAQALIKGRIGTQGIDYSTDWEYTVNDTVTHIDAYIGTKTAITVPARIEQRPTQLSTEFLIQDYNISRSAIKSVTIPNTVHFINNSASNAFSGCVNLYGITIPDGTENLYSAFSGSAIGCKYYPNYAPKKNVKIPNGVTNMSYAFYEGGIYADKSAISCNCFENNTDFIPNTVTDVSYMFCSASFGGQFPNIPNSVKNMAGFAQNCSRFGEQIYYPQKIGNRVENMAYAFQGFTGEMNGVYNIPKSVTNLTSCFQNSCIDGNYYTLQGYLPYVTNVEWAFCNMSDYGQYSSFVLNFSNARLKSLNNLFSGSSGNSRYINIQANWATEMNNAFTDLRLNWKLESIPVNIINMCYAFSNSTFYGTNYTAPSIPSKVINMCGSFQNAFIRTATFGRNVQDISYCYQNCYILYNIPNIPSKVVNMAYTFNGCDNYCGDIIITSPNVIDMTNCFSGSLPKAVYVPLDSDSWYTAINTIDGRNGVTVYPLEELDGNSFVSQFEYYETEDEVIITNYIGSSGEVNVPSRFNYKNVVLGPTKYMYEEYYSGPFINKHTITTVRMSPNVKVMGGDMSRMFWNCSNLTSVPILPKNTVNGAYAFANCKKLSTVGNNIGNIVNGAGMFLNCSEIGGAFSLSPYMQNCFDMFAYAGGGINSLYIPYGITNITRLAYQGKMTCNIFIPGSVRDAVSAFLNCPINEASIGNGVENLVQTFDGTSLINAPTIPNSVISLSSTFANCRSLVNGPTSIGNSVTDMDGTFNNCISLTSVCNIPNSVIRCPSIFENCISLNTRINFGTSVERMTYAFKNATAFGNSVYVYSNNVTNCYNMFYGTSISKTVYVYSGSTTNTTFRNSSMYTNGRNGVTVSYI